MNFLVDANLPMGLVVWLRLGNATNAVLKAWLRSRWGAVVQDLSRGERLIEVI